MQSIIKDAEQVKSVLLDLLASMDQLGELTEYADEDGRYLIANALITPCSRSTWVYEAGIKKQITDLQKRAQVEGAATQSFTTYYRLSPLQ